MLGIFKFLTLFDWITPTIGFAENLINDPTLLQSNSWTFFIPYDLSLATGWNANDIKALLKKHGIHSWGGQYTYPNGNYFFNVKLEQAQWAEYLLLKHGVPLNKKFLGAPPSRRISNRSQKLQDRKQKKESFWFPDDFLEMFW